MYDIITIGTATRDVFIESPLFTNVHDPEHFKKLGFLDGNATCFMPGAKLEINKPIFATGGGATNTATTFARMGLKVATIGKIGADDGGARILSECKSEGVASRIITDKALSTAYSVILVPTAGERTILTHRGASDKLKPADIDNALTKSHWAYIVPGHIPYPTVLHAVNALAKQGTQIALNPSQHIIEKGLRALKPLLSKIDVLILNREEAAKMTGVSYDRMDDILGALRTSFTGIIAVTDGSAGAIVLDHERRYNCGVFPKKVVSDATGAGDAYGSGLVSGLIYAQKTNPSKQFNETSIREAIRIASANSASVVEHTGAKRGILTREAVLHAPRWKKLSMTVTTL
jgi:ribokinase